MTLGFVSHTFNNLSPEQDIINLPQGENILQFTYDLCPLYTRTSSNLFPIFHKETVLSKHEETKNVPQGENSTNLTESC